MCAADVHICPSVTVCWGRCGEVAPEVLFQVGRGKGPVIPVKRAFQKPIVRVKTLLIVRNLH
jgi:hypothetical protein